jgi:AcrR family transcriptional regulator
LCARAIRYRDRVTASEHPDGRPAAGRFERAAPGDPAPAPVPARAKHAGRRIRGLEPEQRRQERRRQLLDSAYQLFATQGYARTSIEQICQGAYVGFKGFYDEFATKEALFLTLYQELVERVSTAVSNVAVDSDFSDASVRELLEAFVHSVLDDRRLAQVIFVEAAGLSPVVEAARRATYRTFADFLFGMWAVSGRVLGLPLPDDVRDHRIALGLVGAIVELMVDWLVDSESDDIARLIDDLEVYCHVLLIGIEAAWPGREVAPSAS